MGVSRRGILGGGLALALLPKDALAAPGLRHARPGLDLSAIDAKVRPGDDFYRYANGRWLDAAEIRDDRSSVDMFTTLGDANDARMRKILEEAASAPSDPPALKLGDLYASLMDERRIEALGWSPIESDLGRIEATETPAQLARLLAGLTRDYLRDPFGPSAAYGPISVMAYPDLQNPQRLLPTLVQGGIGLPDRDYYLKDEANFEKARAAYRDYLTSLFAMIGRSAPEQRAAAVLSIEEGIARAHRPRAELFQLATRYNPWRRSDFEKRTPGLDWQAFFETVGLAGASVYVVADPQSISAVAQLARDLPMAQWRDYLTARTVAAFAPLGPKSFADADFKFRGTALRGTPAPPPRWKRVAATVDLAMGPAVGAIYLQRHFPSSARAAAQAMTANIKLAMARRISGLQWISAPTKKEALAKLAAVRIEIGGETQPRSFDRLNIDRADAWGNVSRAARFEYDRNLAKLDRPVDRGEWDMLPQVINAQANPILVKNMFPAGLIQRPLFDPEADAAVNYGAFGMFVGHELSHIFDTLGSGFDAEGKMRDWWQPADKERFVAATNALAEQYDRYRPFPDMSLNGRQTLHENVADLSGLRLALDAYHHSLGPRQAPKIAGFSGDQRFFLSFAQLWREKTRESMARQAIAVGTHSHGEWRVATIRNIDAWYDSFDVKPGDVMYLNPAERVHIW